MFEAYNDRAGVNRRFVKHGLESANEILGFDAFELDKWDVVGNWDQAAGCHHQFYLPKEDLCSAGVALPAGRRILLSRAINMTPRIARRCVALPTVSLWICGRRRSSIGSSTFCPLPTDRRD